jgi:hypothetical protein
MPHHAREVSGISSFFVDYSIFSIFLTSRTIKQDVQLDIASDKPFLRSQPDTCVAKLSCGHNFSLLGIMYQFVLVDMRCPLCRHGPCKRTKVSHIPYGWRQCMGLKLRTMLSADRDELEAVDAEVARALQLEYESPVSILTEDSLVNMTVYMFDNARTIHFQSYELSRVHGGMGFCLSEQDTSNIVNVLDSTRSDAVRFIVHSRTPGGIPVELANSPVIPATVLYSTTVDLVFDTPHSSMIFRRSSTGTSIHFDVLD